MTSELYEIVKCRDANNHEECLRKNKCGTNDKANCDLCLEIYFLEVKRNLAEIDPTKSTNLCDKCSQDFATCQPNTVTFLSNIISIDGENGDNVIRCSSMRRMIE